MSNFPLGSILLNATFDDLDDFSSQTKRWDLHSRQLDRGPYRGEMFQMAVGRTLMSDASCNRALQQVGATPPGLRTLGILGRESICSNWRNKSITGNDIVIFPESGELFSISQADFHVFTVSFPECLLSEVVEQLEIGRAILALEQEKIACAPAVMKRLRRDLSQIIQTVKADPALLQEPKFVRELEFEVVRMCVAALIDSESRSTPCDGWVRGATARRAMDFILQNKFEALTVQDVCQAVEVTEAALQHSFQEYFFVTPDEYLKAVRLTGIRRRLKSGDRFDRTVANLANNWGFWHLGQFVEDYRDHFGELPSETLRRAAG